MDFFCFYLPVVSEIILNGILADFWRQGFYSNEFNLNVFSVQLSRIFELVPANLNQFLSAFSLVKSP